MNHFLKAVVIVLGISAISCAAVTGPDQSHEPVQSAAEWFESVGKNYSMRPAVESGEIRATFHGGTLSDQDRASVLNFWNEYEGSHSGTNSELTHVDYARSPFIVDQFEETATNRYYLVDHFWVRNAADRDALLADLIAVHPNQYRSEFLQKLRNLQFEQGIVYCFSSVEANFSLLQVTDFQPRQADLALNDLDPLEYGDAWISGMFTGGGWYEKQIWQIDPGDTPLDEVLLALEIKELGRTVAAAGKLWADGILEGVEARWTYGLQQSSDNAFFAPEADPDSFVSAFGFCSGLRDLLLESTTDFARDESSLGISPGILYTRYSETSLGSSSSTF